MDLISYGKASSVQVQGGGVYIGVVTRIDGDACYVQLPRLSGEAAYGPCPTFFGANGLAVGDTVFCAFIGHAWDQLVVLSSTAEVSVVGPQGPQGATGPQGAQGAQGPQGPAVTSMDGGSA
jgi:hypothetical protein